MELNRRTFLKSLMAAAGIAAVGIPPLDVDEAIAEAEQIVATHDAKARPRGAFGSLRVDDKWYALGEVTLDIRRAFLGFDYCGTWQEYPFAPLRWELSCLLGEISGIDLLGTTPHEIEFDLRRRESGTVTGRAIIASTVPYIEKDGTVMYGLIFSGVGALVHSPDGVTA